MDFLGLPASPPHPSLPPGFPCLEGPAFIWVARCPVGTRPAVREVWRTSSCQCSGRSEMPSHLVWHQGPPSSCFELTGPGGVAAESGWKRPDSPSPSSAGPSESGHCLGEAVHAQVAQPLPPPSSENPSAFSSHSQSCDPLATPFTGPQNGLCFFSGPSYSPDSRAQSRCMNQPWRQFPEAR